MDTPRKHLEHTAECWCKPLFFKPCDECNGSDAGCWKCDHGGIPVDEYERDNESVLIVRHRFEVFR